jgi:hypothetical protein
VDLEFDELSGSNYADSSGYGNNATAPLGGVATGSLGHSNKSVSFSGGIVQVQGPTKMPDEAQVWVEAWVQPQAPVNALRTILTKEGAYALKQDVTEFSFSVVGTTTSTPCTAKSSGAAIVAGVWYHVAGWYDGVHAALSINGQTVASVSCPNGPVVSSLNAAFDVGGAGINGNAVVQPYQGAIDEVRVRAAAALPYRSRYVSPWTSVTGDNKYHTFAHGLGAVPSQCKAYWSLNASGTPKRPYGDFQLDCYAGSSPPYWRGTELVMDATNVSFVPYSGGYSYCYWDGTGWYGYNTAYVQVVCDL